MILLLALDEDTIKIYSYKYSELAKTLEDKFDNMILNNKKRKLLLN